jgi:hypothetical protein
MDPLLLSWNSAGIVLSVLIGRQFVAITLRQRQMSPDAGLHWPWEWANSIFFQLWGLGLGILLVPLLLLFGAEIVITGVLVGLPVGFLLRNIWKINTSPPGAVEEGYTGD